MVEVFKTNVNQKEHADLLIGQIHNTFNDYKANFDLDDCDKILRVKSTGSLIQPSFLIELLKYFGFSAEVLPDIPSPAGQIVIQNSRDLFTK